jgi:hypothetical protein
MATRERLASDGKVLTRVAPEAPRTKLTLSFPGTPPAAPRVVNGDPANYRPSAPVARVLVGDKEFNLAQGDSKALTAHDAKRA